jgi:thioredoxin 1
MEDSAVDESNDSIRPKNKKLLRIIVPIIIILIAAGIWAVKNTRDKDEMAVKDSSDFALHVTSKIDLEKLKSYRLPIIIDFGADACIPCKEMAPVLKELNEELRGKAIIKFVDVWKYQAFAESYPVTVIPTQVFFTADGKPYKPKDPDAMQMRLYAMKDSGQHVFTTHEGGLTKEDLLKIISEMGAE